MSVASSKAKLAGLVAHRDPDDPAITEARRGLNEANAFPAVQQIADAWPPLSAETKAKLAVILLGGRAGDGDAVA